MYVRIGTNLERLAFIGNCFGAGIRRFASAVCQGEDMAMNGVIYLVGLIVIILAILSFLGLR